MIMCALLGGVPLMVGTGARSELRRPPGFAIVGDLAVSQVLRLVTMLIVFTCLDGPGRFLGRGGDATEHRRGVALVERV